VQQGIPFIHTPVFIVKYFFEKIFNHP